MPTQTGRIVSAKERAANAQRRMRFKVLAQKSESSIVQQFRYREMAGEMALLTRKIIARKGGLANITLREKAELLKLAEGTGGPKQRAYFEELIEKAIEKANKASGKV